MRTPEEKRRVICDAMGFKDADFLKWQDGMFEAQAWLIDRQKAKNDECWNHYAAYLFGATQDTGAGHGVIHASVAQRQDAFLKAIGVEP